MALIRVVENGIEIGLVCKLEVNKCVKNKMSKIPLSLTAL